MDKAMATEITLSVYGDLLIEFEDFFDGNEAELHDILKSVLKKLEKRLIKENG